MHPLLVASLLSSKALSRLFALPLLSLSPPLVLIKRRVSEVPPGGAEGVRGVEKRDGDERSSPAETLGAYLEKGRVAWREQASRTRSQRNGGTRRRGPGLMNRNAPVPNTPSGRCLPVGRLSSRVWSAVVTEGGRRQEEKPPDALTSLSRGRRGGDGG